MNDDAAAEKAPRSSARDTVSDTLTPPLTGMLVVEYGERLGASVCGTLLAQLGADVVFVECPDTPDRHKWSNRAANAIGKRSILIDAIDCDDRALLDELLRAADVILLSSDLPNCPDIRHTKTAPEQIVCDITAFGQNGPLSGTPYSDALVQAIAGLADTTGDPAGAPCLVGLPFCEVSAGIYAAAATLVAHRVRRTRGFGQAIDIALYDCAVGALSTFLPFHAIGKAVTRSGNRHSLAAPWNAYRASDGWVLICTATDEQWRRLCALINQPDLALRDGFTTNAERITRRGEVDEILHRWTATLTVAECIEQLTTHDLACGPIYTLAQLAAESNLLHRKMIRHIVDDVDADGAREISMPGSPLAASLPTAIEHFRIPKPDEHRAFLKALITKRKRNPVVHVVANLTSPLAGIRVLEIGQYTTAPLVGRQLGALGAQVFKIEPPGGEGSRGWPPTQGNQGYFFAFSNSDKKSLEMDLRNTDHRESFIALLKTADVLVENLKPGALARLGFGPKELTAINPRLIYCGISGFGASSSYPGRPAFDTVVQAMSGFMDLTRANGAPMKAGISAADIVGGGFGLIAILAALELRDQTGHGKVLDISMQDAAVSATASLWNCKPRVEQIFFVQCADGYACIETVLHDVAAVLDRLGAPSSAVAQITREAFVTMANAAGIAAVAVCSVSEVACGAQTEARQLILEKTGGDGRKWPLLNSPLRLSLTPPHVCRPIGDLGEANRELPQGNR
jgi:crotonobetainyl-CoA:carnitine CoA-transferase CaiB-like acyl-CoA transferase